MSSVESSPAHSPVLPTRRLSTRRGSVSASDPWGQHASVNMNPSRTSQSRLTIVRVPQQEPEGGRRHRRDGSNASISSTSSEGKSGRLSFAFSTFTPVTSNGGGRPASPGSSPKLRPSSPASMGSGLVRRGSTGATTTPRAFTRLSPEKLVELARSSTHPRPTAANGGSTGSAPVSFTPLPDDVYLPFIDRPSEVSTLISVPPTAKLFALLSQTFPLEARGSASTVPHAKTPDVTSDPKSWTYADLENWFKKAPREEVDDAVWIRKARQCIIPRSELIWERIKGALGVPPELDTDEGPEIDSFAAYIGLTRSPIDIPQGVPRVGLNSQMLDMDVFEPDSPVVSASASTQNCAPPSPVGSDLELSIEPVLASPLPPPSTVDPTTGANMTSLHEVREEDEEEGEQEEDDANGSVKSASASMTSSIPDIHGLRISTSASTPSYSPVLGPNSFGAGPLSGISGGSLGNSASVSPSPRRLSVSSDREGVYDALTERGPGHPLFPSNFAHLSHAPTLLSSRSSRSS